MSGQRESRWLRLILHLLVALCTAVTLMALVGLLRVASPARAGNEAPLRGASAATGYSQVLAQAPASDSSRVGDRAPLASAGGPAGERSQAAAQAEPLPASLELRADPAQAWAGEAVTVTVRIRATADLAQAVLSSVLPAGLELADGPPEGAEYDATTRTLRWPIPQVLAGDTELLLPLRIGADAADLTVLAVDLRSSAPDGWVSGQTVIRRQFPLAETVITPGEGGELRSADGRVQVTFPTDAVAQAVRVVHNPVLVDLLPARRAGLALQFELSAFTADASATPVRAFAQPLELHVDLHGLVDWTVLPYWQQPFLGYLDEETREWVAMPCHREGDVLVARLDHFSYFGGGTGSNYETGWVLTFNDAHVSAFNGGLNYDYPIAVPAGRGGLTPDVSLSYNSRRVDGVLTWIQADWLGLGWTLDSMSIVRAITPTADWRWGYVDWANSFTLLYKGTGYRLVRGSDSLPYGHYYTEDEQFLSIERRNTAGGNGSQSNSTSEYWIVRLRDGTECRLGHNSDSEQIITTNYYDADSGDPCHWTGAPPGGSPPSSEVCYAGHAWQTVTFQWRVDAITDTHGNAIEFSYSEQSQADPTRERASYLSEVRYNKLSDGNWGSKITFNRAARSSDGVNDTVSANTLYFYQDDYLQSIQVQNRDGAAYKTVRQYALTYDKRSVPQGEHDNKTRRLASIREYGWNGISGGSALPTTTLAYEVQQNKGICYAFWGGACTDGVNDSWDQECFRYERLVTVSNGYGGVIVLSYGKPDDEDDWWQAWNWRVSQKSLSDGQGGGSKTAYDYTSAVLGRCYDNNNTYGCDSGVTDPGGTLVGYANVTESLKTVNGGLLAVTAHKFRLNNETGKDRSLGRELEVLQRDAAGNDLQKRVSTWVTETLSSPTRYFVYTRWISDYVRENGSLPASPQRETRYEYETAQQSGGQYGNLTRIVEYGGGTAYRETVNSFYPNTSAWIVDRPGASWVRDGASNPYSGVRFIYDDLANSYTTSPVRGDLVKKLQTTQAVPSEVWIPTQWITYSSSTYYLPVKSADGNGNETHTAYDSLWKMYPLVVTNVLSLADPSQNLTTTSEYSYTLGQPTRVYNANGSSTSYEYDAFGRLTKVIRPGDGSSYPTLQYEYCDTCSPLRIVSKALITSGQSSTLPTIRFFNGLGQLIQENGGTSDSSQMNVAHTTYNAQGLKAQEYVPYTATFSWSYVALDTSKPKTNYAYDALRRATVVTHTDGTTVCTSYDGYRTLVRDENSHQKLSESDAFGRLIRVKEYTATYASPNWSATAYATTTYGYNLSDGLARVTDTLGNTTVITYDALGRKTAMSDPDMGRWSYGYDNAGNLTSQTDAKGQAITFSYDRLKRLTAKTYPAGSGTSNVTYSYDSTSGGNQGKGQRTAMTDGTGSTTWAYDGRARVVREAKTINGAGGGTFTTTWSYDAMDRVQTMVYPSGEVLTTTYNVLGLADGLRGTLAGQFSNLPYVASRSYNALGLPTQMVLSDTLVTRWGYYALGGAWDSHPALGLTSFGRLWYERTTTPSAGPVLDLRYNYDAVGNVTRAVNFRYAASGWPSSGFAFSDTFNSKDSSNWTWTDYVAVPFNDGGNNVARSAGTGSSWAANFYRSSYSLTTGRGLQLRFKVSASNTQAHFSIEANDATYRRLAAVANDGKLYVQEMDGGSYRYSAELLANLQTNTWYTLSVVVDDGAGFYIEACQADNPAVRGSYHTWMPTGKSWRFHHWIWTGSAYVDEYREFTTSGLDWSPKQWLAYTYDGLDRLTGVAPVSGWQGYTGAYTYNVIGNLTGRTEDGSAWAYTYPGSGAGSIRPHAVITVTGVSSYGYDANGNMVTRTIGADTYLLRYDVENRLIEVKKNGVVTATFGYDGDGKMVTATVGVTTTYYVGNHCERVNGITNTYYYHGGQRIAMRQGNTLYWLLTDYLGSTSMVVAATNALTGELRYKAYGDARYAWGITTTTKYHFTGQREESTIGLYFYNARWYDPALGRFIQPDTLVQSSARGSAPCLPLAVSYAGRSVLERWNEFQRTEQPQRSTVGSMLVSDPQFLNRYTYGRDNPLAYVDDSGQIAWWVVGGLVGGIAGFGSYAITHRDNFEWRQAALWTAGGAVVGATLGAGAQWVAGALGTEAAVTTGAAGAGGAAAAGGGLDVFSRAAEFGIDAYTRLSAAIAHTGLEAHHIIEERFAGTLGLDARWIPSVALTPEEHQAFTSAWRQLIPYGTSQDATLQEIWLAVQNVYAGYSDLLEAARRTLFH